MCIAFARMALVVLLSALSSAPAFAQGGSTASISGVVVDTDGGVIPGADVAHQEQRDR